MPDSASLPSDGSMDAARLEQLRQQADRMVREFEDQIAQNKIELNLFTPAELDRPWQMMAEYLVDNQVDLQRADPRGMAGTFRDLMLRALDQMMTPERTEQMKGQVHDLSWEWLQERNPHGALLQIELSHLDSDKPSENPFLYACFISQMHRSHPSPDQM